MRVCFVCKPAVLPPPCPFTPFSLRREANEGKRQGSGENQPEAPSMREVREKEKKKRRYTKGRLLDFRRHSGGCSLHRSREQAGKAHFSGASCQLPASISKRDAEIHRRRYVIHCSCFFRLFLVATTTTMQYQRPMPTEIGKREEGKAKHSTQKDSQL